MSRNSSKIIALVLTVLTGAGLVIAGNLLSINVIQWWGYIVGWTSILFLVIAVLESATDSDDKPWTRYRRSGGDDAGTAGVPVRNR